MAYDCIRCLAATDNDCDICDECLTETKDNDALMRAADGFVRLNSEIERSNAEIERLRAALKRISELDVPRPVGRAWRQDGVPSRHDACPHDLRMYEDCYACIAEYAGAALEGKEKGDGA